MAAPVRRCAGRGFAAVSPAGYRARAFGLPLSAVSAGQAGTLTVARTTLLAPLAAVRVTATASLPAARRAGSAAISVLPPPLTANRADSSCLPCADRTTVALAPSETRIRSRARSPARPGGRALRLLND